MICFILSINIDMRQNVEDDGTEINVNIYVEKIVKCHILNA